jgi:hypothetical protein
MRAAFPSAAQRKTERSSVAGEKHPRQALPTAIQESTTSGVNDSNTTIELQLAWCLHLINCLRGFTDENNCVTGCKYPERLMTPPGSRASS